MSFQDLQQGSSASSTGRRPSPTSSQAVAGLIFQINTAVAGFRRLVDAIGTAKDTPDHRLKLHNTRQRILQLVKEASAKLKLLSESDRGTNITAAKKVEDAKLAKDFQTTLHEFQRVQHLSSERESTYSPSVPPPSSSTTISRDNSNNTRDEENQPFIQGQKRQVLVLLDNEISFNEAIIDEREQGIIEIQNQIGEVNEIFTDLAVLVDGQGVIIDDIDSNIGGSYAGTTQATVQLSKASKSEKSKNKWCWWVIAIAVLVVVVVVIVLVI